MMTTIPKPMLASPMTKGVITNWSDWVVEEKYDGHRLIVVVGATGDVTAYTRRVGESGRPNERALPAHIIAALRLLVAGVYDGELIAPTPSTDGVATSTDVTRLDLQDGLRLVLFDVFSIAGVDVTRNPYHERHAALLRIVTRVPVSKLAGVELAPSFAVASREDVLTFVRGVWERGGEGAILKRRASTYQAGRRSPDWVKVKKTLHAILTVVGFEKSKGTVRFPGHPFAIVRLRDDAGVETTVKTKDDHELARLTDQWKALQVSCDYAPTPSEHPSIGCRLVIEYQDRTRDNGYRHPRWDRWAEEGER